MHHDLDIHPIPEKVLYINDLSIADTAFGYKRQSLVKFTLMEAF